MNQFESGDVVVGGFFGTASGMGESARKMVLAFNKGGIPTKTANISCFAIKDYDAGPLWPADASQGGSLILHISPDMLADPDSLNNILTALGKDRLKKRRVIGYCYWELATLPPQWLKASLAINEVWAPSKFIADAFATANPSMPVHTVPLPLTGDMPTQPRQDSLPEYAGKTVVLFAYDVRSTVARKNPEAVIQAFRIAAQNRPDAVLVIKVHREDAWPPAQTNLDALVQDAPNIHVLRTTLSQEGMKNLVARADIVMSLHRSEGLGLLMAEGMMAGKPVIATGWSGNLDFMDKSCSVHVPYELVPVTDPQRLYEGYNAVWAEPDVPYAAAALRRLLDDPQQRARMGRAARAHMQQLYALDAWMQNLPADFLRNVEGFSPPPPAPQQKVCGTRLEL